MSTALKEFCQKMPKVELHAHMNGSISTTTMQSLLKRHKERFEKEGRETPQVWETTILKGERRTLSDCFIMFRMIHTLVNDEDSVQLVAYDVVKEFADDGVVYLELRTTPRANPSSGMTKQSYVEAVLCGIDKATSECSEAIHVRLLLSIDRRQSLQEALDTIDLALAYMEQTHHHARVVGIDLSGDPTAGDVPALLPVLQSAKEKGLKLAVHIAEIPQRDEETELLLSLSPDRLGHGTFIHVGAGGSEQLQDKVLAKKIPIEICLTSNVKGQTVSNYENHHLLWWYRKGHPIIICTDDKGVFSTSLSEEYHIAADIFSLTCNEIWQMASSAVDHIFEHDGLKSELRRLYDKDNDCVNASSECH